MTRPGHNALIITVLAALLCLGIGLSWPALQDDSLIHLRYADQLLHHHILSYDGVHASFGDSSLLYVALLALLRCLTLSPLLPRAVSSVAHLVLFAAVAAGLLPVAASRSRLSQLLAYSLLGLLAMPSAVRWLDDGMETPLILLAAAALAFMLTPQRERPVIPAASAVILVTLGILATLLRVELLLLLAVVSILLLLSPASMKPRLRSATQTFYAASPLLAGLLVAALIILCTGHLLPDTAVAKAVGLHAWRSTLTATAEGFASALSFGVVLLLLWLLSFAAKASSSTAVLPTLLANSLFPVTLLLALLRGQTVQGVRYFVWTLFFSALWNILTLPRATPSAGGLHRSLTLAACAIAAALVLSLPVEVHMLAHVFRQRAAALAQLREQHLERLRSLPVVAFDVGYIGYFTQASLCDMAGLVNGRAAAMLSYPQRLDRCAAAHPQVGFVNQPQLDDLAARLDLTQWSICSSYNLANLRASDVHYLIASPRSSSQVCAAANGSPLPLAPFIRPPSDPSLLLR